MVLPGRFGSNWAGIAVVTVTAVMVLVGLTVRAASVIARTESGRKKADAAAQYLASIITFSNDAIIGKTLDGIVTSWNPAAETMYGCSAQEMIGQSITIAIPPDRASEFHSLMQKIGRGEPVRHYECVRIRKGGQSFPVSLSISPVKDEKGKIVGAASIVRDITERKQAEAQIQEHIAQVEAANKELEAFTYSVSHDLRAPLRHVNGFSKILLEEYGASLPREAQEYLQRIQDGARRMGVLIDDLLHFGRVGRQEVRRQVAGLRSLVEEVISDLKRDCPGRQVEWKIAALPFVDCDPALMKQVFQNLLANALKFTRPRAQAIIEVGQLEQNGSSLIYVRDNGVGFSMKYADKLFGVFQRLHRAEDFEGTGVGLATVQRIIQKHGGRIWAEAELDQGAAFYFTLGNSEKTELQAKAAVAGENT